MILAIHIIAALLSIGYVSYVATRPSLNKLKLSYIFAGTTLSTGIVMVLQEPATMLRACVVGIIYFSIVSYLIVSTHKKLASETARN